MTTQYYLDLIAEHKVEIKRKRKEIHEFEEAIFTLETGFKPGDRFMWADGAWVIKRPNGLTAALCRRINEDGSEIPFLQPRVFHHHKLKKVKRID